MHLCTPTLWSTGVLLSRSVHLYTVAFWIFIPISILCFLQSKCPWCFDVYHKYEVFPVRNLNTWPWADWNKWLSKNCMCGCTVKDWMTSGFSEMEQVWVLDGYKPGSSHYRITVSSHFWLVSGPITSGMSSINPCISVWMKVLQTTMFLLGSA